MFIKKKQLLSNEELSAFCQQIALIVRAGLPTYYGISILKDEAPNEKTKDLLNRIYLPMEAGSTLHAALKESGNFPDYMVHMIELGEESGRLEEVLLSLTSYYEREAYIRASIRNAVTYPLIMTIMMIAVIIVLIAKVLPVFSQIYKELGSELTGFAHTLMNISDVINRYMIVFIILFLLILVFSLILYNTNLGKTLFQGKGLAMSIAASRFANCMHLALSSGLDTDHGLDLAKALVNNPHMQEKIEKCRQHMKHGESFAKSVLLSGVFSKIYASAIAIGSKTGSMDDIMQQICISYEETTDEKIQRFLSMLEPTLVIILALFIGIILISFLLPLLGIMSSIG